MCTSKGQAEELCNCYTVRGEFEV